MNKAIFESIVNRKEPYNSIYRDVYNKHKF